MEPSKPVEKTLAVMEYLAAHASETFSLEALSSACGIPKTTLLRILRTLALHGYVVKSSAREYRGNLALTRTLPLAEGHLRLLKAVLRELAEASRQSAEILIARGRHLVWYDKLEHPGLALRIAATVGFTRTLYELDAPARLYLKHLGLAAVQARFDTSAFYTASSEYTPLTWPQAQAMIQAVNVDEPAYDMAGNANGIRRFAMLIQPPGGTFPYLLCLAEPALIRFNADDHLQKNLRLLRKSAQKLLHSG